MNLFDNFDDKRREREIKNRPRHAVHHDRWDKQTFDKLMAEMAEFDAAEDRLTDAIETGASLWADGYYLLVKSDPKLRNPKDLPPSHLINYAIEKEAQQLSEYAQNREYTVGDPIGAAMANIAWEEDLEILADKLKTERKLAEELGRQEGEFGEKQQEQRDLDELFEEWTKDHDPLAPENQEQARNFQDAMDGVNQQLSDMQDALDAGAETLAGALHDKQHQIRQAVRQGLGKSARNAADVSEQSQAWGVDPGHLQRMPAKERFELAKKLNSPRFKRIAEIFGPMERLSWAEQARKVQHARDEIYDLSTGNDLSRVLPMEFADLHHPVRKLDFYRKFHERSLLQYELRGEERVGKGGIIFLKDSSGSMCGDRDLWASAVGLCLLHMAKAQKRSFYGIHFGAVREIKQFDFTTPESITFDRVLDFAESYFGGGTNFQRPLSIALKLLQKEFAEKGFINGDVVFATDGQCGVDPEWLETFKSEQTRLGFRVYGVNIGGSVRDEPLATICDKKVFTIKSLVNGEDLREVFGSL